MKTGDPDACQDGGELWTVSALPGCQQQRQQLAALLTAQVQLRGPATPGTPQRVLDRLDTANTAGRLGLQIPPFGAPAACWCARAMVVSTLTSQVINPAASARACNPVRIRAQVPSRCHRRYRP
jgi:hypothetical protein